MSDHVELTLQPHRMAKFKAYGNDIRITLEDFRQVCNEVGINIERLINRNFDLLIRNPNTNKEITFRTVTTLSDVHLKMMGLNANFTLTVLK